MGTQSAAARPVGALRTARTHTEVRDNSHWKIGTEKSSFRRSTCPFNPHKCLPKAFDVFQVSDMRPVAERTRCVRLRSVIYRISVLESTRNLSFCRFYRRTGCIDESEEPGIPAASAICGDGLDLQYYSTPG